MDFVIYKPKKNKSGGEMVEKIRVSFIMLKNSKKEIPGYSLIVYVGKKLLIKLV